uniref:dUTP diphosphatase n=1 Tax=Geladintestivirus 4 TaxID=3233136 RepID=A0AAU8MHD6_9CAUD
MSQLSNRIATAFINYANAFKETPDNRELAERELRDSLRAAIDFVPVKVWLDPKVKAQIPEYAHYVANSKEDGFGGHATDACCDVVCTSVEKTNDGRIKCGTGIHVALEDRDSITIRPNSRITKMGYVIANSPCTVDESYRGEIFIVFRPITDGIIPIEVGDVIGQMECPHHRQASFKTVKTLEELGITDRGDGAFGSTSKK